MKLKTVEITELKGIDRNAVEGVSQLQPVTLAGLAFGRVGGYFASGSVQSASYSGSYSGSLVGFDQANLFGLLQSQTHYLLSNTIEDSDAIDSGSSLSEYGFIERVGVHGCNPHIYSPAVGLGTSFDGNFIVVDEDNNVVKETDLGGQELQVNISDVSTSAGEFSSGDFVRVTALRYLNTDAGKYVLATAGAATEIASGNNAVQLSFNISSSITNVHTNAYVAHGSGSESNYGSDRYIATIPDADVDTETVTVSFLPTGFNLVSLPQMISFRGNAVSHRNRVYGLPNRDESAYRDPRDQTTAANGDFFAGLPNKSVIYTEQGFANLGSISNWLALPSGASSEITGLASSPAGLLIFGDREAFLMRSDPTLTDFQVQRVSSTIGHDSDYPPAVVGGIVFTVFSGDVYAFALGMGDVDFGTGIKKVSQQFTDVVTFKRVASEAKNRAIVALGDSGEAFRFDIEYQQWTTSFMNQSTAFTTGSLLIPSTSSSGVMWFDSGTYASYEMPFGGATQSSVSLKWEDVDIGDKNVMKMWRRVRIHANDDYSGTPELDYVIDNTSGTITASNETGGRFVFTFPSGLVNEKAEALTVRMVGATAGDTFEPPVTLEFVERYRRR